MKTKQIFISKHWQDTFNRKGYIVLDLTSDSELRKVNKLSLEMLYENQSKIPKGYFPVGKVMDYDLRNKSTEIINKHILPHILKHFIADSIDAFSGTHLVKPTGWKSFVAMHQDSSLVDETKYNSLIGWVPLTNINLFNGSLFVIEGSHLFGNLHRANVLPWAYRGIAKKTYRYAKKVQIKLGQVCYFHSALIHCSSWNFVDRFRLATSNLIIDKGAPMYNYFADKDTPTNYVEVYETDMDFFHNQDFDIRPNEKYKRIATQPRKLVNVDMAEFKRLYKMYNQSTN